MNRGQAIADIAHVRTPGAKFQCLVIVNKFSAKLLGIMPKSFGERPIGIDIQIIHASPVHLNRTPTTRCTRFKAGLHPRLQCREFLFVRCPHVELTDGSIRHDIRRSTALLHDAMYALC